MNNDLQSSSFSYQSVGNLQLKYCRLHHRCAIGYQSVSAGVECEHAVFSFVLPDDDMHLSSHANIHARNNPSALICHPSGKSFDDRNFWKTVALFRYKISERMTLVISSRRDVWSFIFCYHLYRCNNI